MKYGLLKYSESRPIFNVGDYIQSLAAKQFLPRVDTTISREKLGQYNGEKLKMILNGWFTHNAASWVPSADIDPLFVSFHINNTAAPLMLSQEGKAYLKTHEPIGCRDQYTADLLNKEGIKAYFSGCLTLTLDNYKVDDSAREDKVYVVDPLYGYVTKEKLTKNYKSFIKGILSTDILDLPKRKKHLKKILNDDVFEQAVFTHQELPTKDYTPEEKFELAKDLLEKYARAKLVITSRIHCALPCLAMGTPVIFINGFETFVDSCRFEGIVDLFNRIDINSKTGEWTSNFGLKNKISLDTQVCNLGKHHSLSDQLKQTCHSFIKT